MMINDPKLEKERLIENAERFKENFELEFSELTHKVERGLLTGLIVGGLAYITYKIYKGVTSSQNVDDSAEPKKASSDNSLSSVGGYIAQTIALILINLAKEKLVEYLNEQKQNRKDDLPEDSEQ